MNHETAGTRDIKGNLGGVVDSELSPQEGQDTGLTPTEPGATPAGDSASPSPARSDPGVTPPGAYPGYAGQPMGSPYPDNRPQATAGGYPGAGGQPAGSPYPGAA